MIKYTINMRVAELLNYREYDREKTPVPTIPFIQSYTVDQVTKWVKENGISDSNPLELSVYSNTALLTDGNHRIIAASRLNIEFVPVLVTRYETKQELEDNLHPQTINRFKPINSSTSFFS